MCLLLKSIRYKPFNNSRSHFLLPELDLRNHHDCFLFAGFTKFLDENILFLNETRDCNFRVSSGIGLLELILEHLALGGQISQASFVTLMVLVTVEDHLF